MNDNQILVIHSRGVYNFMGKIWCHNCVSLFCYNALFSKMGRLASIMRKSRTFLITNANSLHWLQAQQNMSQIRNASLCVHVRSANSIGILFVHSWKNVPKIWNQFLKTMHYNRTMKHSYDTKWLPIKLYTPLLTCITKIWLSFMNVVKSY